MAFYISMLHDYKNEDIRRNKMTIQKKINLKQIFFVIMTFSLIIETNPEFKQNIILRYSLILLNLILVLFHICIRKKTASIQYILWAMLMLVFARISELWSINPQDTIQGCKNLLIVLLICCMVYVMVENEKDFQMYWQAILIGFLFNAFYVLSIVGFDSIGQFRIGVDYEGLDAWNANSIGAFTSFGSVMLIFQFQNEKRKTYKVFYAIAALFMFFITLNTGSRKAVISIFGIPILYMFLLDTGNKRMRNVLIIFVAAIISWFVIMSNENLYDLIGLRMVRMMEELAGHQTSENSMGLRMVMIADGLRFFSSHPFFGYGMASYTSLSVFHTYAHNNYIELLVGIGLVGTVIYYYIYVSELFKCGKFVFIKNRAPIAVFCFSVTVVLLINHMALVAYDDIVYNCVFMLLVTYVRCSIRNRK